MVWKSRLTAALDKQLRADKEFETKTKAEFDRPAPASLPDLPLEADKNSEANDATLDSSSAPPPLAPPLEPDKDSEANTSSHHHQPDAKRFKKKKGSRNQSPPSRSAATSALLPQVFEDRYARGWSDAWDLIRPQQYDLQRQYILARKRNASVDRWMRWLPVVCFVCTLFGFASGWLWGNISTSRLWSAAQKLETIPRVMGDRGDKLLTPESPSVVDKDQP
jgi:hypothetical protein